MSKNIIRKDKTCLNCRHVVEQRFCPNCGQENTESRKTFHHLFVHFFEDLTHYENAFWRTIKNLIFKPSALTKEYLSGKRLSYLAPVRLYIFISFITFFMITIIPDSEDQLVKANQQKSTTYIDKQGKIRDSVVTTMTNLREVLKAQDSIENLEDSPEVDSLKSTVTIFGKEQKNNPFDFFGYKSVRELDSLQKIAPPDEKLGEYGYWFCKKITHVREHNARDEIFDKFKESFMHNIPKVLFIYMPIFALFLWLFHNKKRWYYFDHGIFTLHYFSFLLLIYLLLSLIDWVFSFSDNVLLEVVNHFLNFIGGLWLFYYFFPAHHRFYGESRFVSFLKSIILFFINCILILILLTVFAVYTFINIH